MVLTDDVGAVPVRIVRLARISQALAIGGIALIIFGAVLVIALAATGDGFIDELLRDEFIEEGLPVTITPTVRIATMAFMIAPSLLMIWALDQARRLFTGYRRGEIMTPQAAKRVRSIGWIVFALGPFDIVISMLAVLALTILNAPGERTLAIDISDVDVFAVVLGLLIVVIGHILREAALVAEENRGFV